MTFCPNCGSKKMHELNIEDETNNPEGMTHYCKRCGRDFMIVWGACASSEVKKLNEV
jgi:DNA-directed RNA polymerase subunit RPC12/RpoP